jgi:hypothetical protein
MASSFAAMSAASVDGIAGHALFEIVAYVQAADWLSLSAFAASSKHRRPLAKERQDGAGTASAAVAPPTAGDGAMAQEGTANESQSTQQLQKSLVSISEVQRVATIRAETAERQLRDITRDRDERRRRAEEAEAALALSRSKGQSRRACRYIYGQGDGRNSLR